LSTICGVGSDRIYRFGEGEPAVDILVHDPKILAALAQVDELAICDACMAGSLDVVGDMLRFVGLRGVLSDSHPLVYLWRRIAPWLIERSSINRRAIATHYELDNDFYLEFLDATRCCSQAVFERDDEALETAQSRKLNFAVESCGLKPGDRVLDVGGGWAVSRSMRVYAESSSMLEKPGYTTTYRLCCSAAFSPRKLRSNDDDDKETL
jgi:cyclopropane-fatty-acyl-phospholipid synthase